MPAAVLEGSGHDVPDISDVETETGRPLIPPLTLSTSSSSGSRLRQNVISKSVVTAEMVHQYRRISDLTQLDHITLENGKKMFEGLKSLH
jgi:hypothetical protein